jgi:hypothetical protein
MRTSYKKLLVVAGVILFVVLAAKFAAWWWTQRQWFELQKEQLLTIRRIEAFPPAGWDRRTWKEALIAPHNVWGSVTFSPDYSNISIEEMRSLKLNLEQIVAETTSDNSFESVDRIFQLMLEFGRRKEFISGYRDEFRSYSEQSRQKG